MVFSHIFLQYYQIKAFTTSAINWAEDAVTSWLSVLSPWVLLFCPFVCNCTVVKVCFCIYPSLENILEARFSACVWWQAYNEKVVNVLLTNKYIHGHAENQFKPNKISS